MNLEPLVRALQELGWRGQVLLGLFLAGVVALWIGLVALLYLGFLH